MNIDTLPALDNSIISRPDSQFVGKDPESLQDNLLTDEKSSVSRGDFVIIAIVKIPAATNARTWADPAAFTLFGIIIFYII
jgi:hypothetical protein